MEIRKKLFSTKELGQNPWIHFEGLSNAVCRIIGVQTSYSCFCVQYKLTGPLKKPINAVNASKQKKL